MMIRQQGQVLPLGLALLLFGVLGAFVLFNTGQVATDKMRLANTADAAAYSGVLWQARALNFNAYTNRAMVANQVSIAQAVTLQSWAAYGAVSSENIATVLKPVPVLNVIASGLETGLAVVEKALSPVTKAMVAVVDVVNRGLSLAQEAMFVSTFVATPDVIRAVVQKTDERFDINTAFSGLGVASNLNQWRSFTEGNAQDDHAAMDERAALINQSRDGFTRDRNWRFFSFWFYSTPLTRHRIYREGDTRLIKTETPEGIEWEWKAKDTMSLHNRLWHWKGTKRWEVPVGWAEAFANTKGADHTIESGACTSARQMRLGNCSRFLGMNRHAEYLADIGAPSPVKQTKTRIAMKGYTGIQAYRSLSAASIQEGSPHLQLKIEVGLPVEKTNGSNTVGSKGRFDTPIEAPGERLSSISVAEVFYKRPDADTRLDDQLELANLYNPYWDTRLSSISAEDRLLAFSQRLNSASTSVPDGLPSTSVALSDYRESDDLSEKTEDASAGAIASFDTGYSGLSGFAVNDGFHDVTASIDNGNLNQFKESIKEQLNDALRKAVKDMLAGALPDQANNIERLGEIESLSQELTDQSTQRLAELVSPEAAEPYLDAIADAERVARELEQEFERIRRKIVDDFAIARMQVEEDVATEQAAYESSIDAIIARMESSAPNEEAKEDFQQSIQAYQEKIWELQAEMQDRLAYALMDVVNGATDLYVMRLAEARFLVTQLLRDDSDTVSLPWLEAFGDD